MSIHLVKDKKGIRRIGKAKNAQNWHVAVIAAKYLLGVLS